MLVVSAGVPLQQCCSVARMRSAIAVCHSGCARWSSTSPRFACWGCTCGQGGPRHARQLDAIRHRVGSSVQHAMHNLAAPAAASFDVLRRHRASVPHAMPRPCPMPRHTMPCCAAPVPPWDGRVLIVGRRAVRRLLRAALEQCTAAEDRPTHLTNYPPGTLGSVHTTPGLGSRHAAHHWQPWHRWRVRCRR